MKRGEDNRPLFPRMTKRLIGSRTCLVPSEASASSLPTSSEVATTPLELLWRGDLASGLHRLPANRLLVGVLTLWAGLGLLGLLGALCLRSGFVSLFVRVVGLCRLIELFQLHEALASLVTLARDTLRLHSEFLLLQLILPLLPVFRDDLVCLGLTQACVQLVLEFHYILDNRDHRFSGLDHLCPHCRMHSPETREIGRVQNDPNGQAGPPVAPPKQAWKDFPLNLVSFLSLCLTLRRTLPWYWCPLWSLPDLRGCSGGKAAKRLRTAVVS